MTIAAIRPRFLGSSAFLAAAIAFGTVVPASAETAPVTTTITNMNGAGLSALVGEGGASLASVQYSYTDQHAVGSETIAMADSTGTGLGWHVTQQASVFTNGSDATTIPAGNLTIATTPDAATKVAGMAVDVTHGPLAEVAAGTDLGTPRTVESAHVNYGQGSYTQVLALDLLVPAFSHVGTYSSTITTTISQTP